jgi:hypothetical protein
MSTSMWMEVAKSVVPAVLSSSIVAFYFQRRLKRIGSFEKVTEYMLQRMVDGGEDLNRMLDDLCKQGEELYAEMKKVPPDVAVNRKLVVSFRLAQGKFKEKLDIHRIYITHLVPFGTSDAWEQPAVAMAGIADFILSQYESGQNVSANSFETLDGRISGLRRNREQLRKRTMLSNKKILEGQLPW